MDHWIDDSPDFHKHRFVEIVLTFFLEKLENSRVSPPDYFHPGILRGY
jgi:hypothetical protein